MPPRGSSLAFSLVGNVQCSRVVRNRLALLVREQHLIPISVPIGAAPIVKIDVATHFGRILHIFLLSLGFGSHNLLNLAPGKLQAVVRHCNFLAYIAFMSTAPDLGVDMVALLDRFSLF
jgi:hypothetical protein